MEILAFSDLHGNRELIDLFVNSVIAKRLNPDIFVCAGDIGDSIIVELLKKMLQFRKPIFYVLGNHELLLDNDPKEEKKAERLANVFHLKDKPQFFEDFALVGQDAWTDFADDRKIDKLRYEDLLHKFRRISTDESRKDAILVTHHAPSGVFDKGISYPDHSWEDKDGMHGGSYSIRKIVEEFKPAIHIFAHCHSDGGKWRLFGDTMFANVCHLERETRDGRIGINGSFMIIDTDKRICIPHHLSNLTKKVCTCGAVHYLNYNRCFNCYENGRGIIDFSEIKKQ
jgi:Icc-related predicted phosphoesterase